MIGVGGLGYRRRSLRVQAQSRAHARRGAVLRSAATRCVQLRETRRETRNAFRGIHPGLTFSVDDPRTLAFTDPIGTRIDELWSQEYRWQVVVSFDAFGRAWNYSLTEWGDAPL